MQSPVAGWALEGGQLAHGGKKEEMRGPDVEKFVEFTVEVGRRW